MTFRRLCEREWGMFPFVSELKIHEKQHQYELFRYRFPTGLFGLPGITRENPNPYRLHVPAELQLRRGERAELRFTAIADSTDLEKWGGVEVNVLYGKADDHAWIFTPDAQTPETFPLEITLYLPNGWPVGHAESLVRVGEVAQLPSVTAESRTVARTPETGPADWPECLPVPGEVIMPDDNEIKLYPEQAKTYPEAKAPETPAIRKIPVRPLSGPVFWVGSRGGGSNDVTTRLRQKHPELQFYRLEEHPVLPSSKDPRYTFEDLTRKRHDINPLLDSRGNVSWQDYRRREQLPDFPVIVLALGYEEVLSGERTGFKIVPGIKALETFAEALAKASPQTRILVVLPIPPSQQPEKYGNMIFNRYNYPFRRGPWLAYCRLVREITAAGEKLSNITVLPTHLLVEAGSAERDPAYLSMIEAYLQTIQPKGNP